MKSQRSHWRSGRGLKNKMTLICQRTTAEVAQEHQDDPPQTTSTSSSFTTALVYRCSSSVPHTKASSTVKFSTVPPRHMTVRSNLSVGYDMPLSMSLQHVAGPKAPGSEQEPQSTPWCEVIC
mmetsp:Transcript_7576/g.20705  ORF Transcript_7576/g.20705 Transcript_7576/m.20705 type:complete len:122 (+) Transcript_7576:77-442(+)